MALVELKTWGEQLVEVQTAISAVMSGSQRYEINGRMVQRADLEWLQKRQVYLTDQFTKYGNVVVSQSTTRGAMQVSFT